MAPEAEAMEEKEATEQKALQVDKLVERIQRDPRVAKLVGTGLLCQAAAEGNPEEVKAILELGVSVNEPDAAGKAPLHYAVANSTPDVVELLLAARALPNLEDIDGSSPLQLAQVAEKTANVTVLLEAGGTMGAKSTSCLQQTLSKEGCLICRDEVDMGDLLSETLKSSVYRGTWRGTEVVAKIVKRQQSEDEMEEITKELIHEIEVLTSVHHPDLVMFLGAVVADPPYMFITEFMDGGDLERYYMRMRREKQTPNWRAGLRQQVQWCGAVARALCFLHNCKPSIIHRDLKPLNLLLSGSLDIKVTDFGISKMIAPRSSKLKRSNTIGVGSLHYMAPEVVRGGDYDEKADIYSFALIMYFMSSGRDPFWERGNNPEVVLQAYGAGEEPRPNLNDANQSMRQVMKDSWAVDPKERPDARELAKRFHDMPAAAQGCACSLM